MGVARIVETAGVLPDPSAGVEITVRSKHGSETFAAIDELPERFDDDATELDVGFGKSASDVKLSFRDSQSSSCIEVRASGRSAMKVSIDGMKEALLAECRSARIKTNLVRFPLGILPGALLSALPFVILAPPSFLFSPAGTLALSPCLIMGLLFTTIVDALVPYCMMDSKRTQRKLGNAKYIVFSLFLPAVLATVLRFYLRFS